MSLASRAYAPARRRLRSIVRMVRSDSRNRLRISDNSRPANCAYRRVDRCHRISGWPSAMRRLGASSRYPSLHCLRISRTAFLRRPARVFDRARATPKSPSTSAQGRYRPAAEVRRTVMWTCRGGFRTARPQRQGPTSVFGPRPEVQAQNVGGGICTPRGFKSAL